MDIDNAQNLSQLLRDQRTDHDDGPDPFSVSDVARDFGISQSYASQLELGRAGTVVPKWPAPKQKRYLQVYRFTAEEIGKIAARFDLDGLTEYLELVRESPIPRGVSGEGVTVQHLGIVSAVRSHETEARRESAPEPIVTRYGADNLFSLDVAAISMITDDVRERIPLNSRVYFRRATTAKSGDIVCCRLQDGGLSVIKRHSQAGEYLVLQSYDRKRTPIIVNAENPATIEGVYVTHVPLGFAVA